MDDARLWKSVRILAILLGIAYLIAAIVGGIAIDFDSSGDRAFWFGFLIAGGVILLAAVLIAIRSRWLVVLALAVGGILGALTTFWAVLPELATLALIVLAVMWARRAPGRPASA